MTESFSVKPEQARRVAHDADEVGSRFQRVGSDLAHIGGEHGDVITHGDAKSFRKQVESVAEAIQAAGKWLEHHAHSLREAVDSFERSDHA